MAEPSEVMITRKGGGGGGGGGRGGHSVHVQIGVAKQIGFTNF